MNQCELRREDVGCRLGSRQRQSRWKVNMGLKVVKSGDRREWF